ncbi:MAG: response regulator [Anaerolinea sp.]|nr:response regulator [Anaerolinea sp.]
MRILYVEDNPANLSLMQRIARMGGHEVITYTEGEAALDRFEQDNPDLILLDVQLAGKLSGVDLVQRLRARGITKPVIAVTAYAMVGDRERFLEAGFDDYMSKPLPVAELVELVQKYELQLRRGPDSGPASPVSMPDNQTGSTTNTTMVEMPQASTDQADPGTTQADRSKTLGDVDLAALVARRSMNGSK